MNKNKIEIKKIVKDLMDLTKIRLTGLVMVTTLMGLYTAPHPVPFLFGLVSVFLITLLVMGACTLNCYIEKNIDGLMNRTKNRPLPAQRMRPEFALILGLLLTIIPLLFIWMRVNTLTAILGLISTVIYLFIYTPLKRVTPYAVYVGAIPGALPPLMGQVAASGQISASGLILFSLLFWWQIPHFLAISIRYFEDYAKANIFTFPLTHGILLTRYKIVGTTLLTSISGLLVLLISPYLKVSLIGVSLIIFLNLIFFLYAVRGLFVHNDLITTWARKFFFSTIIYFPLILMLIILF